MYGHMNGKFDLIIFCKTVVAVHVKYLPCYYGMSLTFVAE